MPSETTQHHQTLPEDRIPVPEKLGFGIGNMAACGAGQVVGGLVYQVYNMTFGVSPALIGTVSCILSVLTSLIDPFIAQFSDNFRSRWGRRRPLMAVAAAPMMFMVAVIYLFPRGLTEHGLMLWMFVTSGIFSVAGALYWGPLSALCIEATTDYHERIRVGTIVSLFMVGFGITNQWIFPLVQSSAFRDPIQGLRVVVSSIAAFLLICAFVPVFLCRERRYAKETKKLAKISLRSSLFEATKNRPFCIVLSIKFFTFFCYNVVGSLGVLMNTYYVYGGDVKKAAGTYAVLGSSYILAAFGALFVYPHIARSKGKRTTLQIASAILVLGCVCKLFVYQPKYPWLQVIVLMANGISVQGINFTIGTMLGDIIDYDEFLFGKRREALYGSLVGWFEKAGGSLAGLICGFLLVSIGFNAKNGAQPEHTLQLMRLCYFLCPFTGALFAMFAISRYELSEERVYEIKDVLARRHSDSVSVDAVPCAEPVVAID